MRRLDVARGAEVVLDPLIDEASGDVSLLLELGDAVVGAVIPLDVPVDVPVDVSGFVPLGMPVGARVESLVGFAAGRLRSTSPVDVLVTLRDGDALSVDRMQSVVLIAESALVAVVVDETLSPVVALAPVAPVGLVDGVVPVPFAPFVVFSPVKR